MANVFLKPQVIAATALGLLQREIKLPGYVWTDAVPDFAGKFGDTVTIRIPASTTARRRDLRATGAARNITMDELTETGVDVKLDTDIYSAVPVTDEELTLDISDFGGQILQPQIVAVAEGLEDDLVDCMQGANYRDTVTLTTGSMYDGAVDVRTALNDNRVPSAQRTVVVGSSIEAAFLKDPQFVRADQSGDSSNQAMREAVIGRVAGLTVVGSQALDPTEGYAFHRTAYIMATRAPKVPDGASFGQSTSYAGLAMRWLKDYDFTTTTDRSLVDAYAGFKAVDDGPVTDIDGAGPGTETAPSVVRAVKLALA